jgi:hypothetical protein
MYEHTNNRAVELDDRCIYKGWKKKWNMLKQIGQAICIL